MDWYRFGLCLKPNPVLEIDAPLEQKLHFWHENMTVVQDFLHRWGVVESASL